MASSSKSPSPRKNRGKSNSPDKKKSNRADRSPSSGSSHSSRSSRSRRSAERGSRSRDDKSKDHGRYPPRRDTDKIPQSAKLFVTNIDSKYSQEQLNRDLRNLFEPFGKIKDIIVKTKQGSSNSYCFVEFEEVEGATKAQEELRGKDFKGKELKVEFGRGERKNEDRKSDKCYICHKEGHFAKDCRYNRYTSSADVRKDTRDDRDRGRDRDGDRRHRRRDSRSRSRSSSESRSYRRRHNDRDRDDYRRRDTRRSPEKRGEYYSRRH